MHACELVIKTTKMKGIEVQRVKVPRGTDVAPREAAIYMSERVRRVRAIIAPPITPSSWNHKRDHTCFYALVMLVNHTEISRKTNFAHSMPSLPSLDY